MLSTHGSVVPLAMFVLKLQKYNEKWAHDIYWIWSKPSRNNRRLTSTRFQVGSHITVGTSLTHRRGESIEEKRGSLLIHSFTSLTRLLKQLILHLDCNFWSACSGSHLPSSSVHIKMEPCEWKGSRCIFRSRVKVRSTEGRAEDSLQSPPAPRNNPTWAGVASFIKK